MVDWYGSCRCGWRVGWLERSIVHVVVGVVNGELVVWIHGWCGSWSCGWRVGWLDR